MGGDGFEEVGTGLTVYEDDRIVEGPVRWLDSPAAVVDFVSDGQAPDSIALVRGGTTTFLTPALTSGVKGVITLQGAPESHLGILSREYGIPCLISVTFTRGVKTSRGETIPADGTIVRLDVSTSPKGRVLAEPGAPTADEKGGPDASTPAAAGPTEEEMAQILLLLEKYQGETPHGSEGDRLFRQRLSTDVLLTGDDQRDLTRAETNDLLAYMGFTFWDALSARATEGESGLIPRQEYEAFGCVQIWQRYPEMLRFITDEIGVDGLVEIGRISRSEVGTKANMLHIWAAGFTVAFGRGISMGLGRIGPHEREADLVTGLQFMRRLYRGLWGPGQPVFTSMKGYEAPLLDDEWITRFRDEFTSISDPALRARYQRFSANTELMGFLLHFDNRCGLHDTGPYPTGDGGFLIVRDHFLSDEIYHWADVAEDLPHAITQAMFFKPEGPLELALLDIGTLFTKPGNYLKHLTGMTAYARDRWDTPPSQIRRLDDAEMDRIQATCTEASSRLYQRIATMSRRDKVMAGGQVYYTEFLAPFARAAGLWDRLKSEFDFFEIDPVASEAYYDLVTRGAAMEMVPRLFLTGAGYPPVEDPK
ncbi:MAG: PEP-utilizing enzyme [Acidimicrobiia bacterium]